MAVATLEKKATTTDGGRKFRVTKGQVGPWSSDPVSVFDEKEFKRIYTIPGTDQAKATIDPETYHGDLLDRLLALNVIVHAPDDELTPSPIGPEATPGKPVLNESIRMAVKEALDAREKAALNPALPLNAISQDVLPVQHGVTRQAK